MFVWQPSKVPSLTTSLHQKNIQIKIEKSPKSWTFKPATKPWKYKTAPKVVTRQLKEDNNGIILGSTKWKACRWVKKNI